MKKYLTYAIIALAVGLFFSVNRCSHLQKDRNRLSDNQRSLLTQMESYRFRDSLNAASIEKLTLSVSELKAYYPDLKEDIKDLGVKLRRVEHIAQTATESTYPIETVVRDSIVIRDTVVKTLKCIDFDNRYVSLSGCEENGSFRGDIRTVDTLLQVVHRVPRRFLFFRFGTKAIRQEVVSKNPYARITYSEYLEIKK